MSDELDPMEELEREAKRQDLEEKAAKAVSQARARLVLGKDATHTFFASLALRLEPVADWTCDTAWTDGKRLGYNPEWFLSLPADQQKGVAAHEVGHLALGHHARRESREPRRFNEAADLSLNPLLQEGGLAVPPCGLFPGQGVYAQLPVGKSAEWYYDNLPERKGDGDQGGGGGKGQGRGNDPGGCGAVRDPGDGSEAARKQAEAEWKEAVAQATHAAKQRGQLPGSLARLVEATLAPKVDWKSVLRDFVTRHAKADYSWSRPNRRFVGAGLYLPSQHSDELGDLVLLVDTSGSIGAAELARFAGEIRGIIEAFPNPRLTVVYHDTRPAGVQQWSPQDGPLVLEPRGGGGTSHAWLPDWLDQQESEPACVVCLTDCETDYPRRAPGVPVLWAVVGNPGAKPPFGQVVEVE